MNSNKIKNIIIELLKDGKSAEITAQGISMYPLLHPGDKLLVKKYKSYKKGDIIIFDRGDAFVAHRIISTQSPLITSKGDSLIKADTQINQNEILGKIIARTRNTKTTNTKHWQFRLLAMTMPFVHPILSLPFALIAIAHQKHIKNKTS